MWKFGDGIGPTHANVNAILTSLVCIRLRRRPSSCNDASVSLLNWDNEVPLGSWCSFCLPFMPRGLGGFEDGWLSMHRILSERAGLDRLARLPPRQTRSEGTTC
jgi:hypothetical protein